MRWIHTHVWCNLVRMDKPFSTKFCAGPFPHYGDTPRDARGEFTKLKTRELTSILGVGGFMIILQLVE